MTLATDTGLITGLINHAAAASSPYSVQITVDDGVNAPVSDTFTWTITNVPATVPYVVAGTGGAGGGDDLLTTVDETDFDPATNEVDIGIGTGTSGIEAAAIEPLTGDLYAVDGSQLGVLNIDSGVFVPVGTGLGTGDGEFGPIAFGTVTGTSFHPMTGQIWAIHQRPGLIDVLFVIDPATGAHVPDVFGPGVEYLKLRQRAGASDFTDLSFDPTDWSLYGVLSDGAGTDFLVTIRRSNGNLSNVGTLPQAVTGLSFDDTGQLWGTTASSLHQIDKSNAAVDAGRPLDNASDYGAVAFAVSPALPPAIGGVVFGDLAGDGLAAGQSVEDTDNPGVPGVTVSLYLDSGLAGVPGEPDATDTLIETKTTGPTGSYFFAGFLPATYYVVVDSTSIIPTAGGTGWAEQTYGPTGSVTFSGTYSFSGSDGLL